MTYKPILKEAHSYPFGLTMAGISSKAAGGIPNKRKFNEGTELENGEFSDGSGLELYATDYRSYDPQIGRFHQIDELADYYEDWSPYVFAYDNPILFNDPLGLSGDSTVTPVTPKPEVSTAQNPTELKEVVVKAIRKKNPLADTPTQSATPQPEVVDAPGFVVKKKDISLAGSLPLFLRSNPEVILPAVGIGGGVILWHLFQPSTYNRSGESWGVGQGFNLRDNATRYVPPIFLKAEDKTDRLKGGSQKQRDESIKRYPVDFQRWYHKHYKKRGDPDATKEELKELLDQWHSEGSPKVK